MKPQYFSGGAGAESDIAKHLEKVTSIIRLGYNFTSPSIRTRIDRYVMRNTDLSKSATIIYTGRGNLLIILTDSVVIVRHLIKVILSPKGRHTLPVAYLSYGSFFFDFKIAMVLALLHRTCGIVYYVGLYYWTCFFLQFVKSEQVLSSSLMYTVPFPVKNHPL